MNFSIAFVGEIEFGCRRQDQIGVTHTLKCE